MDSVEVLEAGDFQVRIGNKGIEARTSERLVSTSGSAAADRIRELFRWFREERITQGELVTAIMEGLVDETELRNLTCAA